MSRAAELAARQQQLRLRSAELRFRLADEASAALGRPLALADQARAALSWIKRNPEWPIGAAVLLLVLRPRRALHVVTLAWSGWRALQSARRWLDDTPRT